MELSKSEQRLLKGVEKTQRRRWRIFVVVLLIVMTVYMWGLGALCAWRAHRFYCEHKEAAEAYLTAAATHRITNPSAPPGCVLLMGVVGFMGVAAIAFLSGLWFLFALLIDIPWRWRRERLLLRLAERLRELGELETVSGGGPGPTRQAERSS